MALVEKLHGLEIEIGGGVELDCEPYSDCSGHLLNQP